MDRLEMANEMTSVMRMMKTLPQDSKKWDFVNVSVVINSFFLDH